MALIQHGIGKIAAQDHLALEDFFFKSNYLIQKNNIDNKVMIGVIKLLFFDDCFRYKHTDNQNDYIMLLLLKINFILKSSVVLRVGEETIALCVCLSENIKISDIKSIISDALRIVKKKLPEKDFVLIRFSFLESLIKDLVLNSQKMNDILSQSACWIGLEDK